MDNNLYFKNIDLYWRAANYLTVAFMYLKDNVFLQRPLMTDDLKEHPSGHWGTSPGINFIIAHLNYFISQTNKQVQLVIGPGHAGNSLFVNLLLEETLQDIYPIRNKKEVLFDIDNIHKCLSEIRTEIGPFFPGTIYDGGELGYSLPVAFGSVIDSPDLLTVCIVGDGEFETGTISSSWRCKQYLDQTSGMVLPVIHLNGYRMGDKTILSQYNDQQIYLYFKSMGYEAKFVRMDHNEMFNALNWANKKYEQIKNKESETWPVIILKSLKGYTAPNNNNVKIQGTLNSHKDPLRNMTKKDAVNYLTFWLKSYHPEELFTENGLLKKDVSKIIPDNQRKLGRVLTNYDHKKLLLPATDKFSIDSLEDNKLYSNISILEKYLADIINQNSTDFMIVSPDELKSNLLGGLKTEANYKINCNTNRVFEILNENICQGCMQGYILSGRNCLMISYEAFMPIVSSMVSQFSKWIYQSQKTNWRKNVASLNYILTSLWESNAYSHQNPDFLNHLIDIQQEFIRIYMPIDANTLLACTEQCLSSENRINAIIATKQYMPQFLDIKSAINCVKNGYIEWELLSNPKRNIDLIIVGAGDYPTRECHIATNLLKQYLPNINLKLLSILELTCLGNPFLYKHALNNNEFGNLFPKNIPVVFCFHGYPTAIKSLLFDRPLGPKFFVMGYNNQSTNSTNDLNKMILNGMSRYDIVLKACDFLRDKISTSKIVDIENDMKKKIKQSLNR